MRVRPRMTPAFPAALLMAFGAGCAAAPLAARTDTAASAAGASVVPSPASVIAAMPKNLPRAKAPGLAESIAAAEAAVKACTTHDVKVSALVADVKGVPVVLLSGDGAGVRSQLIAQTKVNIVVKYGMPSAAVAEKAKRDPALAAEAAADPAIGMLRGGGLPVMRNGEMIGVVAVSGAGLSGDLTLDEKCARVAVDRLEAK